MDTRESILGMKSGAFCRFAAVAIACAVAGNASALSPEWRMTVEEPDGRAVTVTSGAPRDDIEVVLEPAETADGWNFTGRIANNSKGLAQCGAPHGVRAFCVTPGPVMTRHGMANMKTLQGRQSQPVELVDFILYLASENGASITGTNYVMDCGRLSMQPQ